MVTDAEYLLAFPLKAIGLHDKIDACRGEQQGLVALLFIFLR